MSPDLWSILSESLGLAEARSEGLGRIAYVLRPACWRRRWQHLQGRDSRRILIAGLGRNQRTKRTELRLEYSLPIRVQKIAEIGV